MQIDASATAATASMATVAAAAEVDGGTSVAAGGADNDGYCVIFSGRPVSETELLVASLAASMDISARGVVRNEKQEIFAGRAVGTKAIEIDTTCHIRHVCHFNSSSFSHGGQAIVPSSVNIASLERCAAQKSAVTPLPLLSELHFSFLFIVLCTS